MTEPLPMLSTSLPSLNPSIHKICYITLPINAVSVQGRKVFDHLFIVSIIAGFDIATACTTGRADRRPRIGQSSIHFHTMSRVLQYAPKQIRLHGIWKQTKGQ
jgi:hypothetical protein